MPGPFTYLGNIPAATDELSVSQGQIQQNFTSIQSFVDVNHADFTSTDAGKHIFVTLTSQGAIPPAGSGFLANEVGLYNAVTNGQQELFINKTTTGVPTTYNIPCTQSTLSTNAAPASLSRGFTYLPSGIIMKWGSFAYNSGTVMFDTTVAFTQILSLQFTTYTAGIPTNSTTVATSLAPTGFTFLTSAGAGTTIMYMAIGY